MTAGGLDLWTVTRRPDDLPGVEFAARRWFVGAGRVAPVVTDDLRTAATLEALRAQLPPGLYRLSRDPADDPAIVEVWL